MKILKKIKPILPILICLMGDMQVYAKDALTLGVFPRRNPSITVEMFSPLVRYLSDETGIKVQLQTVRDYTRFWGNIKTDKYDIVHFNQLHYVESHEKYGYKVFAKNEEFGQSTISSALIIRTDTGINSLEDLKGKQIIFGGGKKAMIAYIGVKLLLLEAGLKESDYNTAFARNPPNSSFAVYFKRAAAGGVGDIAMLVPSIHEKMDITKLKLLKVGKPQPHLPWAFSSNLDKATSQKIKKAFLNLINKPDGRKILGSAGLTGLLPAEDSDYDISREILRTYENLKD